MPDTFPIIKWNEIDSALARAQSLSDYLKVGSGYWYEKLTKMQNEFHQVKMGLFRPYRI
jgi:hypothetical protein